MAERETVFVPAGNSLSLSCVVQHCGGAWTGNWTRRDSMADNLTARHHLTNVPLSDTQTRLSLNLLSVGLLDQGAYACSVKWARGDTEEGNTKYVNVTAGSYIVYILTTLSFYDLTLTLTPNPSCTTRYSSGKIKSPYFLLQPSLLRGAPCTGFWSVPAFVFVFPSSCVWFVV